MPRRIACTPAMNVVATAPIPGNKIPSFPLAGLTSTPFLRAMAYSSRKLDRAPPTTIVQGNARGKTWCQISTRSGRMHDRSQRRWIVGHDAVGAEREQTLCLVAIVDDPEIDAQPEAVALRDERRAVEANRALVRRHLRRRAGERQLPPQQGRQRQQRRQLALRQRALAAVAEPA